MCKDLNQQFHRKAPAKHITAILFASRRCRSQGANPTPWLDAGQRTDANRCRNSVARRGPAQPSRTDHSARNALLAMAAAPPAAAPALAAAPRVRMTRGARLEVIAFIAQSFDSLSSGKVLPRDNGPIHKQWLDLIRRHDCIANDKAISRVLLLYKRCRDKTSMIVDATLGHQDDLWAVTLIQLGDTNAIAQKALLMAAASPLCTSGPIHRQYQAAIDSITTTAAHLPSLPKCACTAGQRRWPVIRSARRRISSRRSARLGWCDSSGCPGEEEVERINCRCGLCQR